MKTLIIILMVTSLMVLTTGVASANWGFDIDATGDSEDGNWTTDGDATSWDIVFWTDSGQPLSTDSMTFHLFEVGTAPANLTISHVPFGMPPDDILWDNYLVASKTGDQGEYLIVKYFNDGGNILHLFSTTGIQDGETIFKITADSGTSLTWGSTNTFIINENAAPGDTTLVKAWQNGPSTINEMYRYTMLKTEGYGGWCNAGPPPGSPAFPVLSDYSISTDPADNIDSDSAQLSGTVNPWHTHTWDVYYVCGTAQGGPYTHATSPTPITGDWWTSEFPLVQSIDTLIPDTTYFYRIRGDEGPCIAVYGAEQSFTTLGATQISQYISGTGTVSFGGQVNATVNCTTFVSPGTITITVHSGEFHPQTSNDTVQVWYEITSTASGTFDLTLDYGEHNLNGENEGELRLWRYTGSGWEEHLGTVNTGSQTVTVTGISQFSDWVVGDASGPVPPVPEMVTIVLLSLGLTGLISYFLYRRLTLVWR